MLTQTGVTRQSLKVGDIIAITGAPSRDPEEHKVLMQKIRRLSDGWSWGDRPDEVIKGYTFTAPTTSAPTPTTR